MPDRLANAGADIGLSVGPATPDVGGWLVRPALGRRVTRWQTTRVDAPIIVVDDSALLAALGDHGAE